MKNNKKSLLLMKNNKKSCKTNQNYEKRIFMASLSAFCCNRWSEKMIF